MMLQPPLRVVVFLLYKTIKIGLNGLKYCVIKGFIPKDIGSE